MKIVLADVLGYCMGVRRAVESAQKALSDYSGEKTVYTLGPLIHNQVALDSLAEKGLKILDENNIQTVEKGSVVIIRAHGVPPKVLELLQEQECVVINATCPRVLASQKNAKKYAAENRKVILTGDKNHGEVTGIAGYAGDAFILVENVSDAEKLVFSEDEKAVLISQTTFSPVEFEKISSILSSKIKDLKIMNSICPATRERQDSLLELCPKVGGILVVGGKNSANTKRLLQTAELNCKKACLIEEASEIPQDFFMMETVGITAGASTPDKVISEVKEKLLNI